MQTLTTGLVGLPVAVEGALWLAVAAGGLLLIRHPELPWGRYC